MRKKILVTGGAGYIGSVTVKALQKAGYDVVVFDNLVYGHRRAVNCKLIVGDLLNNKDLKKLFAMDHFDGVIHFAAYALAGESMENPYKYFQNNLMGGLNLLEVMREKIVNNIVFSSSCAVYGYPDKLPVNERTDKNPVSVYGETKWFFERILNWYDQIYGIKNIPLRYFNACGAEIGGTIGEDHSPETHIIPLAINVAMGKREKFVIFGDDYDTEDGTCVRDYVHAEDLASAHMVALEYLFNKKKSDVFNIGTGKGYSNMQVIDMVKQVSGKKFKVEVGSRREGDPDAIYADNSKVKKELGWEPKYSDLETIVKSAYNWHKANPKGFSD